MGWFTGIVVFLLTWWTLLFAVLPFGHKRDTDGTPLGSPNLKKKLLITSLISAIVWLCIYGLIQADIISFRDMARTMTEEDRQL